MSAKRRRSKRVSKSERVMLNITTPPPAVQDIVVTVEVSAHGAKVLARRTMQPEARGSALFIAVGREVPCRVAWQRGAGSDGRMETGLEIYTNTNFWGLDLTGSEVEPEPVPAPPPPPPPPPAASPQDVAALLEALKAQSKTAFFWVDLWCALGDGYEARGVFTREELIASLRKIGKAG